MAKILISLANPFRPYIKVLPGLFTDQDCCSGKKWITMKSMQQDRPAMMLGGVGWPG